MDKQDNKYKIYTCTPMRAALWKYIAFVDSSSEHLWGEKEWHGGILSSSTSYREDSLLLG